MHNYVNYAHSDQMRENIVTMKEWIYLLYVEEMNPNLTLFDTFFTISTQHEHSPQEKI